MVVAMLFKLLCKILKNAPSFILLMWVHLLNFGKRWTMSLRHHMPSKFTIDTEISAIFYGDQLLAVFHPSVM